MIGILTVIEADPGGRQLREPHHEVLIGGRVVSVPTLTAWLSAVAPIHHPRERKVPMAEYVGRELWRHSPPSPLGKRGRAADEYGDDKESKNSLHIEPWPIP